MKVKLCLGPLGGDVVAELPFILMHPKPPEELPTTDANLTIGNCKDKLTSNSGDTNNVHLIQLE